MNTRTINQIDLEKIYNKNEKDLPDIFKDDVTKINQVCDSFYGGILSFYDSTKDKFIISMLLKDGSSSLKQNDASCPNPLFNFNKPKFISDAGCIFTLFKNNLNVFLKKSSIIDKRFLYLPVYIHHLQHQEKAGEILILYKQDKLNDKTLKTIESILEGLIIKVKFFYIEMKMKRKTTQLNTLINFTKTIETIRNKNDLLKAIIDKGLKGYKEIFGYTPECILRERTDRFLKAVYLSENIDFIQPEYSTDEPLFHETIKAKTSKIISDLQNDPGIKKILKENERQNRKYFKFIMDLKSIMLIPFVTNKEVKGIYVVYSKERVFNKDEMRFFKDMAIITSVAFNKLEAYEIVSSQLDEKGKRLALLNSLIKDIISEKDDKALLDTILQAGLQLVNAESGNIRLINRETNMLKKLRSYKPLDGNIEEMPIGKGVCGRVIQTGEAQIEYDAYSNKNWQNVQIKDKGEKRFKKLIEAGELMRSEISAPLKDCGVTIGTIDAHRLEPYGFNLEDLEILKDLGLLAGIVLKRSDLLERLSTMRDITRYYQSVNQRDINNILDKILKKTLEINRISKGAIAVEKINNGRSMLEFIAVRNIIGLKKGQFREIGKGIMGEAAKQHRGMLVGNVSEHIGHINIDQTIKSELVMPMIFDNKLKGIVMIASSRENRFDEDDFMIIDAIANQTGILIHNITLIKEEKEENYRKMENELIKNLMNFSGMMAHQINNLLGGISTHASVIKDKLRLGKYDIIDNLNSIFKCVEDATNIIDKIRQFTKKIEIELKFFSLHEVLDEALEIIKDIKISKDIKIIKEYDLKNIKNIRFDRFKMLQVFLNIIQNAYNAMQEKGDTLVIKTFKDEDYIKIIFEDNGIGIPEENQEKIFRSFFTTNKDGTGLGLAISKRFVELHRGSITLESMEGIGTKLIISLPICLEGGITHE